MGGDFFKSTIGDQVTLQRGFDITKKKQRPGTIPVVSSGGTSSFHDEAKVVGPGVVLGRKGSLGTVFYLASDFWPHDTTLWVKDFKGNDPMFVYYFFKNMAIALKKMDVGAANPALNRNHVHPLSVMWTKATEQKAIAHILGSLDDKIQLNRQMNTTLEAMAQALFKSWFVDFDPVIDKALAAGNPIPESLHKRAEARRTLGDKRKPLPADVAQYFPDRFVFNEEMGWVPEGWKESTVGTEFNITMGQSPPGNTYNEHGEGIPFFQGRTDFGFRYPTNRIYCTAPKRFASKGDSLVSVRAPVGDVNMAALDCCVGRGVSALRHKSRSQSFTYYSMLQLREYFNVYEGEGTVFGSINQKDFKSLPQMGVLFDLVSKFDTYAGEIDEKIELNTKNICSLTSLRDTLLPKLLSGQFRISNAENFFKDNSQKKG